MSNFLEIMNQRLADMLVGIVKEPANVQALQQAKTKKEIAASGVRQKIDREVKVRSKKRATLFGERQKQQSPTLLPQHPITRTLLDGENGSGK